MNIFDSALDKMGEGVLDSQANNIAKTWVKDGHLDPKDQPALVAGLKILVGVLFSILAEGQDTK
jgi:hypothetical protein